MFLRGLLLAKRQATRIADRLLYWNARINRKRLWRGIERHFDWNAIHIANVNFCNARCVFCGQHKFDRKAHVMSMATFAALAGDARKMGIKVMDFTPPLGDPLLDQGLLDKARMAKSMGFKELQMTTNGILLRKWGAELLEPFNLIRLSIGGFSREAYKEAYQVDRYDEVIKGLKLALFCGHDDLRIHVFLRTGRPIAETVKSEDFLDCFTYPNFTFEQTNFYDNWGGAIQPEELVGQMVMRPAKKKAGVPCIALFQFFAEHSGNIRLCGCRFKDTEDDELVVGNIHEDPLERILHPDNIMPLLRRFEDGAVVPKVCQDCTLYRPIS